MKRTALALVFAVMFTACDNEKAVTPGDLPEAGSSFITDNFSGRQINGVIKDKEGLSTEYKVVLSDGTQLKFYNDGKIKEVQSASGIPASVVPPAIASYINTNYPDQTITEWGMDDNLQKAKLSSGVELEFDKEGNFKRIDS